MKKTNRLIACILTLMLIIGCVPAPAEETSAVIAKTCDLYFFRSTNVGSIDVVFFSENEDIPYIAMDTAAELLRVIAGKFGDTGYEITDGIYTYGELEAAEKLILYEGADPNGSVYMIERENGSFVLFDAESDTIWMSDRDLFMVSSFAISGGDLVSNDGIYTTDEEQNESAVNLYKRSPSRQFVRIGDVTTVYLEDYDIHIRSIDGMLYLPVATLSDLILPAPMTYNGEAFFLTLGDPDNYTVNENDETLLDLYYKPVAKDRSEELAYFNYFELCLMLDQCYGLAETHGVSNGFNQYFLETGLVGDLCSTDINVYTQALEQLVDGYFGDQHSTLTRLSPYSGGSVDYESTNRSISLSESAALAERFAAAREAAGITQNGQIIDGYSEVGDTAFITFDSFSGASMDYYDSDLWPEFGDIYMSDTVSLVIWAQDRIHRENSPIRKVVIDLSCNGGGSLDACVYIAAWVLGAANISIENVRSGARYSTNYWVDTNLDGMCTEEDDLGIDQLDVYCLISGNSFSCGNLLPVIFKQDSRVTLVGQASGGGSCLVRNTSTADGTLLSISDFLRMSIVKNGSFYDIDQGVEPDIPLRKYESYYDREALMEYLKSYI